MKNLTFGEFIYGDKAGDMGERQKAEGRMKKEEPEKRQPEFNAKAQEGQGTSGNLKLET